MRFRAEPWVDRSRPSGPGQRALCPDPGLQCCRSPRGWRDTHLGGLDGGDLAEKRGSSAKGGRRENPGKQPAVARRWISSARPRLECRRVGGAPGLTLAVQRPRPGAVPVGLGGGETGQPSVFGRVDRERGGGGSEGGAHLEPVAGCCEELCWCWTVVPSRTRCAGGERGAWTREKKAALAESAGSGSSAAELVCSTPLELAGRTACRLAECRGCTSGAGDPVLHPLLARGGSPQRRGPAAPPAARLRKRSSVRLAPPVLDLNAPVRLERARTRFRRSRERLGRLDLTCLCSRERPSKIGALQCSVQRSSMVYVRV